MHAETRDFTPVRSDAAAAVQRSETLEQVPCTREHRLRRRVQPPKIARVVCAPACKLKCQRSEIGIDHLRRRERGRSEEHTSELQSPCNLVCRLLLEKKKSPLRPGDHITLLSQVR